MKYLKYLLCINNHEQNKQSEVDQYLIKEYNRLGLIEKQLYEELKQQKLLEEQLLQEKEQKELEQKELEQKELEQKELEQKELEEQKLLEERRKLIINTVFLKYKDQYKEFYSTHHSPIHSHFNKIDFLELSNTMNFNNEIELIDKLNDYNNKKRQDKKAYNNLSTKRRLKCDVFNFYLFI